MSSGPLITWLDVAKALGAGLVAIGSIFVGWYLNQRADFRWRQFEKKQTSYESLIRSSRGFLALDEDTQLKTDFLDELNICWLYAPDTVISCAYKFLETVRTGVIVSDSDKAVALAALVATIREDLLTGEPVTSTKLKTNDFKLLTAKARLP